MHGIANQLSYEELVLRDNLVPPASESLIYAKNFTPKASTAK